MRNVAEPSSPRSCASASGSSVKLPSKLVMALIAATGATATRREAGAARRRHCGANVAARGCAASAACDAQRSARGCCALCEQSDAAGGAAEAAGAAERQEAGRSRGCCGACTLEASMAAGEAQRCELQFVSCIKLLNRASNVAELCAPFAHTSASALGAGTPSSPPAPPVPLRAVRRTGARCNVPAHPRRWSTAPAASLAPRSVPR